MPGLRSGTSLIHTFLTAGTVDFLRLEQLRLRFHDRLYSELVLDEWDLDMLTMIADGLEKGWPPHMIDGYFADHKRECDSDESEGISPSW